MLVDTPYSMGCYKVHLDLQANPPSSTQMSDLSPAKCLFHCLTENDNQRYAGKGRCVLMAIFYHINIRVAQKPKPIRFLNFGQFWKALIKCN